MHYVIIILQLVNVNLKLQNWKICVELDLNICLISKFTAELNA